MPTPRKALIVLVCLALGLAAPLAFSAPAAAATVDITLYGSRAGWGTNRTNIASPGPDLAASNGDTITLTVNSTDRRTHTWFLDYNNDSAWNTTTEPGTTFPNLTTRNAVTITFVVNHTGSFKYRSVGAADAAMVGNFTIASGGLFGGASNTVLIVIGVVILIVAVVAVATMYRRRTRRTEPPPPPER